MSALPQGLAEFIAHAGWVGAAIDPLPGDASFRRYFRLSRASGESAMLMHAPPPHEDPAPFLHVAHWLNAHGMRGPAILAALGHAGEVPSPTFTIIETYDSPPLRLPVVHADFYRLDDPAELAEIGLDDYRDGAVLLAEWPDHAGGFDHEPGCLAITLEPQGKNGEGGRIAIARGGADWVGRMP